MIKVAFLLTGKMECLIFETSLAHCPFILFITIIKIDSYLPPCKKKKAEISRKTSVFLACLKTLATLGPHFLRQPWAGGGSKLRGIPIRHSPHHSLLPPT